MASFARLALHSAATVLMVCASAAQPVSASSSMGLPDCLGAPKVRPAEIVLACADANFTLDDLKWTGWGARSAAATGVANVNDCTPSCVAGHFHAYRVTLTASGRQTCPGGRPAYSTVTYAWVGRSPFKTSSARDRTQTFACAPRT